jgi:AcrR family transcriptional regulator
MIKTMRLSAEVRRRAIVEAVRDVFAEKGFDGTTTRDLAKSAGVSEALIYRYFPSKESLYAAMLDACAKGPTFVEYQRILALEASASTLVIMAHFVISGYVQGRPGDDHRAAFNALLVRSLLDDGAFVRLTHRKYAAAWIQKFDACLNQAVRAGDMQLAPLRAHLCVWFVQHVGFSLMLHLRPKVPAINYKVTKDELIEQATWFALRGLGLRDEAIRRFYNPKAFSLLAS